MKKTYILKKQDFCVVCWNKTEFKKDTPIDQRIHYVKGVGQLCYKCWKEIYGKNSEQKSSLNS